MRLRDVEVGVLPVTLRVNAGLAEIRVVHEGYEAALETRTLAPRTTTPIDVTLAPARTTGQLTVVVRPATTSIRVDGSARGTSGLTLDLEPGTHQVVLAAPQHETRSLAIAIAKGERRRLDLALDRRPTPLLESPWFWAGAAAVVVGAVVTTLVLTLDRSPEEGSLGTYHLRGSPAP